MKKIVSLVLILTIVFSMAVSGSATTSKLSVQQVKEELQSRGIDYLYVGEEEEIKYQNSRQKKSNINNEINLNQQLKREYIKVNSYEEIEELIKEIQAFNDSQGTYLEEPQTMSISEKGITTSSKNRKGTGSVKKWAPLFGTFAWKTIYFDFEYSYYDLAGEYVFESVNDNYIDSNITGISAVQWDHKSGSSNISSCGRSVTLHVSGEYILGIEIGDFPIGIPIAGDWKLKSKGPEKYNI